MKRRRGTQKIQEKKAIKKSVQRQGGKRRCYRGGGGGGGGGGCCGGGGGGGGGVWELKVVNQGDRCCNGARGPALHGTQRQRAENIVHCRGGGKHTQTAEKDPKSSARRFRKQPENERADQRREKTMQFKKGQEDTASRPLSKKVRKRVQRTRRHYLRKKCPRKTQLEREQRSTCSNQGR